AIDIARPFDGEPRARIPVALGEAHAHRRHERKVTLHEMRAPRARFRWQALGLEEKLALDFSAHESRVGRWSEGVKAARGRRWRGSARALPFRRPFSRSPLRRTARARDLRIARRARRTPFRRRAS